MQVLRKLRDLFYAPVRVFNNIDSAFIDIAPVARMANIAVSAAVDAVSQKTHSSAECLGRVASGQRSDVVSSSSSPGLCGVSYLPQCLEVVPDAKGMAQSAGLDPLTVLSVKLFWLRWQCQHVCIAGNHWEHESVPCDVDVLELTCPRGCPTGQLFRMQECDRDRFLDYVQQNRCDFQDYPFWPRHVIERGGDIDLTATLAHANADQFFPRQLCIELGDYVLRQKQSACRGFGRKRRDDGSSTTSVNPWQEVARNNADAIKDCYIPHARGNLLRQMTELQNNVSQPTAMQQRLYNDLEVIQRVGDVGGDYGRDVRQIDGSFLPNTHGRPVASVPFVPASTSTLSDDSAFAGVSGSGVVPPVHVTVDAPHGVPHNCVPPPASYDYHIRPLEMPNGSRINNVWRAGKLGLKCASLSGDKKWQRDARWYETAMECAEEAIDLLRKSAIPQVRCSCGCGARQDIATNLWHCKNNFKTSWLYYECSNGVAWMNGIKNRVTGTIVGFKLPDRVSEAARKLELFSIDSLLSALLYVDSHPWISLLTGAGISLATAMSLWYYFSGRIKKNQESDDEDEKPQESQGPPKPAPKLKGARAKRSGRYAFDDVNNEYLKPEFYELAQRNQVDWQQDWEDTMDAKYDAYNNSINQNVYANEEVKQRRLQELKDQYELAKEKASGFFNGNKGAARAANIDLMADKYIGRDQSLQANVDTNVKFTCCHPCGCQKNKNADGPCNVDCGCDLCTHLPACKFYKKKETVQAPQCVSGDSPLVAAQKKILELEKQLTVQVQQSADSILCKCGKAKSRKEHLCCKECHHAQLLKDGHLKCSECSRVILKKGFSKCSVCFKKSKRAKSEQRVQGNCPYCECKDCPTLKQCAQGFCNAPQFDKNEFTVNQFPVMSCDGRNKLLWGFIDGDKAVVLAHMQDKRVMINGRPINLEDFELKRGPIGLDHGDFYVIPVAQLGLSPAAVGAWSSENCRGEARLVIGSKDAVATLHGNMCYGVTSYKGDCGGIVVAASDQEKVPWKIVGIHVSSNEDRVDAIGRFLPINYIHNSLFPKA